MTMCARWRKYYLVRDKVSFLKIKKVLCYFLVKDIIYLCTISQLICSLRINSSRRTHIGHVLLSYSDLSYTTSYFIALQWACARCVFHRASMGISGFTTWFKLD